MNTTPEELDRFVQKNLGLVHSCANRLKGRGIEYDDLYGAGCVGLLKAVAGFDESRGLMFSTYAVPVILGEMKRLFRDGGAVKVSRGLKELSLRAVREQERFMKEQFRQPTVSELAERLCVSCEQAAQAISASIPPVSLTVEEGDGNEFDLAQDSEEERLCEHFSLQSSIRALSPDDRALISLRYFKGKTQTETAKALNMTQVQVSRREKKILISLKQMMAEE